MPEMITRAHLVRQLLDAGRAARQGAGGSHRLFKGAAGGRAGGLIAALRPALGRSSW